MSLQLLLNLNAAQDVAQVDGMKHPWTADRLRSYPTTELLLGGKSGDRVKRYEAGPAISEKFDGKVVTDFAPAQMGSDYQWNGTGSMDAMQVPYREFRWSQSIFRHEVAFQGGSYNAKSHSRALWNILDKKNLDFELGPITDFEMDWLWRTPDPSMEDPGTQAAPLLSLPCVINQWTAAMGTAGAGIPPGFAAQQSLDPADFTDPEFPSESLAEVRKVGYSDGASGVTGSGNTTVGAGHLLESMSLAARLTKYDSVPMVGRTEAGAMVPGTRAILCTEAGYTYMEQTVRAHGGDQFRIVSAGAKDNLTFSHFPLRAVPALTGKAIYPDVVTGGVGAAAAQAMVTEGNVLGLKGPRYYFIDPNGVDFFAHAEGYWAVEDWYALKQINPDKIVKHGRLWANLFFRNFRQHCIVKPDVDQSRFVGV